MTEGEKEIIYLLRVNPDPQGTLEIDGEKFRVYEEIDSRYKDHFEKTGLTASYLDSFKLAFRQSKQAGDPKRNLEVKTTIEGLLD